MTEIKFYEKRSPGLHILFSDKSRRNGLKHRRSRWTARMHSAERARARERRRIIVCVRPFVARPLSTSWRSAVIVAFVQLHLDHRAEQHAISSRRIKSVGFRYCFGPFMRVRLSNLFRRWSGACALWFYLKHYTHLFAISHFVVGLLTRNENWIYFEWREQCANWMCSELWWLLTS